MLKNLIFVLFSVVCSSAFGQDAFPFSELKFQRIFGQRHGDKTTYCLLGTGFFRTISSDEEDMLVRDWMNKHPEAKAVPVAIIGEGTRMPIVYIWVVDGDANMNLFLIEKGAFPGSVMRDAVQFEAISREARDRAAIEAGTARVEKDDNKRAPGESAPRRFVQDSAYDEFVKKLDSVEEIAQEHKAGIWADKFKEMREE